MSCVREECVCLFTPGACPCPCNACAAENVSQPQPALLPRATTPGRPNFCSGRWWNGKFTSTCNANALPGEALCAGCKLREHQDRVARAKRLSEEQQQPRRRRA